MVYEEGWHHPSVHIQKETGERNKKREIKQKDKTKV